MSRGRKPKDLAPNDPDQYVQMVQRMRAQWHPDLVPALLAWLHMQERIHRQSRADLMARHHQLPPAIRDGAIRDIDGVIKALSVLGESVVTPFRRSEWYASVNAIWNNAAEAAKGPDPRAESEA